MSANFFLQSKRYAIITRPSVLHRRQIVFSALPDDFSATTKISQQQQREIVQCCLDQQATSISSVKHDISAYRLALRYFTGTEADRAEIKSHLWIKNNAEVIPLRCLVDDGLTAEQLGLANKQSTAQLPADVPGFVLGPQPEATDEGVPTAPPKPPMLGNYKALAQELGELPDKFLLMSRGLADEIACATQALIAGAKALQQENQALLSKIRDLETQISTMSQVICKFSELRESGITSPEDLIAQYPELASLLVKQEDNKDPSHCRLARLPTHGLYVGATIFPFVYSQEFIDDFVLCASSLQSKVVKSILAFSACGARHKPLDSTKPKNLNNCLPAGSWVSRANRKWRIGWRPPSAEDGVVEFVGIIHHSKLYSSEA